MNLKQNVNSALSICLLIVMTFAVVWFYFSNKIESIDAMVSIKQAEINNISLNTAILVTNKGEIEIELLKEKAPLTVENFVKLAKKNFFDGIKFHRVIKNFMIQTGDPLSRGDDQSQYGTGGPGYIFKDEINDVAMVRGMVAMANRGPDTNGSQFFIVTAAEAPWLNGKHTVFGRVVRGMEVVDEIQNVPTSKAPFKDIPLEPVVIQTVVLK
jgi:cyclophilin family peptidyl-prolyl cis-trans isomerase